MEELLGISVYGIAVGNVVEPDFPSPKLEIWSSKKHHWLDRILGENSYPQEPNWNEMPFE